LWALHHRALPRWCGWDLGVDQATAAIFLVLDGAIADIGVQARQGALGAAGEQVDGEAILLVKLDAVALAWEQLRSVESARPLRACPLGRRHGIFRLAGYQKATQRGLVAQEAQYMGTGNTLVFKRKMLRNSSKAAVHVHSRMLIGWLIAIAAKHCATTWSICAVVDHQQVHAVHFRGQRPW
jgi:hypothetical protein